MQMIIFLIEVSLIFLLIDMDSLEYKSTDKKENQYSSYYSLNDSGENILLLTKISQNEKIKIWKNSTIKDEILDNFPNIEDISNDINRKIIDDNNFKEKLIDYIEYIQGKYLSGEITQDEFREAIENPDPSLPSF